MSQDTISRLRLQALGRKIRNFTQPLDNLGRVKKVSDYYGELIFDFKTSQDIPDAVKREILSEVDKGSVVKKEHAEIVAKAVTDWAAINGATHFCHWFQPLTGGTAEKHDAFFQLNKDGKPIENYLPDNLCKVNLMPHLFPMVGPALLSRPVDIRLGIYQVQCF